MKPLEERSRQSQPETGCLSAVSLGPDPEGGGGSSEGRGERTIRASTLTASVVKYEPDLGSGKNCSGCCAGEEPAGGQSRWQ